MLYRIVFLHIQLRRRFKHAGKQLAVFLEIIVKSAKFEFLVGREGKIFDKGEQLGVIRYNAGVIIGGKFCDQQR